MIASSPLNDEKPLAKAFSAGRWLLSGATNLLFPPACNICEAPLEGFSGGSLLCVDCQRRLVWDVSACPACGSSIPESMAGQVDCAWCRDQKLRFDRVVRLGRYVDPLRRAVLDMKHRSGVPMAMAIAALMQTRLHGELTELRCDVVLPIPMHWVRRMWRGVNNPSIVGQRLASALSVPFAPHLLSRSRATEPQAYLSPDQRRKNVRGAFRVHDSSDLAGARVLLVDDILTTGATASEAARALKRAGAMFVAVVVLARAEGGQI